MAGAVIALAGGVRPLVDYVLDFADQSRSVIDVGSADAEFALNSNGQWVCVLPNNGTWCTDASKVGLYEALVTPTAGSLSYGATGTWVALNASRQWGVVAGIAGTSKSCTFTVQIRRIGKTTILASATIGISAAANSGGGGGGDEPI